MFNVLATNLFLLASRAGGDKLKMLHPVGDASRVPANHANLRESEYFIYRENVLRIPTSFG
jgi:hypothetical protein